MIYLLGWSRAPDSSAAAGRGSEGPAISRCRPLQDGLISFIGGGLVEELLQFLWVFGRHMHIFDHEIALVAEDIAFDLDSAMVLAKVSA